MLSHYSSNQKFAIMCKIQELNMSRNLVQFQKGMSDADFDSLYGTEERCRKALFTWRWPKGFTCPVCGAGKHSVIETRGLYQCSACRSQVSLTMGTKFHSTKLLLQTWFRAMYHITQTKGAFPVLNWLGAWVSRRIPPGKFLTS
jgi:ribosomal protein L37AE/L43A